MDISSLHLIILSVATAPIPDEAAFSMLTKEFVDSCWRTIRQNPGTLAMSVVVSKLITTNSDPDGDIQKTLQADLGNIATRMFTLSTSEMLTRVVARPKCKAALMKLLHTANTSSSAAVRSRLTSNRVERVMTMFLDTFRNNYAVGFRYEASIVAYASNSFSNYFMPGHNRDIWAQINEVDYAKGEFDYTLVKDSETPDVADELPIRELLLNIGELNHLMFRHSGHSDDTHGICYDVVYLVMGLMCRDSCDRVNTVLASCGYDLRLSYRDPYDWKTEFGEQKPNKGCAAKVSNAKEIVDFLYTKIRDNSFSMNDLLSMRQEAFQLGRKEREGRNCVWEDYGDLSCNALTVAEGRANHKSFDIIVKGVASTYALLREMIRGNISPLEVYQRELFTSQDMIRHSDYLSMFKHVSLIEKLRAEAKEITLEPGLLDFEGMLNNYAGSSSNGRSNIKSNRLYATMYGFLAEPRLKRQKLLRTPQRIMRKVRAQITSFPRSVYELSIQRNDPTILWGAPSLNRKDLHADGTSVFDFNIYMNARKEEARTYTEGGSGETIMFDASVGSQCQWCLNLMGMPWIYAPMSGKYFAFIACEGDSDELVSGDVKSVEAAIIRDRQAATVILNKPLWGKLVKKQLTDDIVTVDFKHYIGYGIDSPETMEAIQQLFPDNLLCRESCRMFFQWFDEIGRLQASLMQLMTAMLSESAISLYGDGYIAASQGKELLAGIGHGVFSSGALEAFLREVVVRFDSSESISWMVPVGTTSMVVPFDQKVKLAAIDKTAVELLMAENVPPDYDSEGAYSVYYRHLSDYTTLSERFVALFNLATLASKHLMQVRDAFELMAPLADEKVSMLSCELDRVFGITDSLTKSQWNLEECIQLKDKRSASVSIQGFASEITDLCQLVFTPMLKVILRYKEECEGDIVRLLNYDVMASESLSRNFRACGRTCVAVPNTRAPEHFATLRKCCTYDETGFFVSNGSYLTVSMHGTDYFIHASGYAVMRKGTTYEVLRVGNSGSQEEGLFIQILNVAVGRVNG